MQLKSTKNFLLKKFKCFFLIKSMIYFFMNFFYGINTNFLRSEIQIPTFQNKNLKKTNLKLFKSYPENKRWVLQEVVKNKINDYFYILKNDDISNKEIFFLADESIIDKFNYER